MPAKRPAKKAAGKVTMRKKGKAPVTFQRGGLHESTNTPMGEPIPASKMQRALSGGYGPKAKKQAVMAKGMLAKGRRTAARKR
jgi:hypothetical protein